MKHNAHNITSMFIKIPSINLRLRDVQWRERVCSHYAKFCIFRKKICQRETILSANDFLTPPKFSHVPPKFKDSVNYLWRPTVFCRARKSIFPWHIPFNWSTYFVIERSRVNEGVEWLSPHSQMSTGKGSGKLRFQTVILQVDGGVDVCWAAELKTPWFCISPQVISQFPYHPFMDAVNHLNTM